jgi:hypothetical protein
MTTVNVDSTVDDETRRARIYAGEVFAYSPSASTRAFAGFAQEMIEKAFAPLDPVEAQFELPVERFVEIVAPLQPAFIHHPESKRLIQAIIDEFGCDLDKTYLDVPRMRVQAHGDYLTSGVGYRIHPHRDTWYAAPMCQLNWWFPIYSINAENTFTFFPAYWDHEVKNTSDEFNLYDWNANGRKDARKQIHGDSRKQPAATRELDLSAEVRVVVPAGGLVLFSGAQLHATVPNTSGGTRFSIDFRTVHLDDATAKGGAPNLDSQSTGTTLAAHLRGRDLEPFPEAVTRLYDPNPPTDAVRVYTPDKAT